MGGSSVGMTLGTGGEAPNVAARGERMLGLDPGADDENVAASRAA